MPALTMIAKQLRTQVEALTFSAPVTHVYNPLAYAWEPHRQYLIDYGRAPKKALFVGMNPGPFGMAQTGVPFGHVTSVRDWLGIEALVEPPVHEHPKRPIQGFDCQRSEISGLRFWSWAASRFNTAEHFHQFFFVWNYCPLVFMEASGRNRTPDKLPGDERARLFASCDRALLQVIDILKVRYIVGIGRFATDRIQAVIGNGLGQTVVNAPHPSPANPAANRGWATQFEKALNAASIID